MRGTDLEQADKRHDIADADRAGIAPQVTLKTLATYLVVATMLHFGSEVFLPLAFATLVTFALSPIVTLLRKRGLPKTLAVVSAVAITSAIIGLVFLAMADQLGVVAQNLPKFQSNILAKLSALRESDAANGVVGQIVDMVARITDELSTALPAGAEVAGQAVAGPEPMQVAVVENQNVFEVLQEIVLPIISPIITAGLVFVVVVFMLMEREELRERFIRLVGSNDLHRTTEMLEDAGGRVASYLLTQLLVNVIYAVPIGLGLWAIGVPNPVLWALMTLILRFIPYFGSIISAAAPLFLAFAVSPDWSMVIWTASLFGAVELLTSNIIEPWLYGARTGLSPLAIIVAAIVWTWIWGPMGLIMSTPLTVCLVVLGRYSPQFAVFDILFGDKPVLQPHTRLYQRLLMGDALESAARAEEMLEVSPIAEYYQQVGIPALLLAQSDYDRGVLTQEQEERIAGSAGKLVEVLAPLADEEWETALAEFGAPSEATDIAADTANEKPRILVAAGRSRLDGVAAAMLAQALTAQGADAAVLARGDVLTFGKKGTEAVQAGWVILCFLDPSPARASLLVIRRIKRAMPALRIGVVLWQMPDDLIPEAPTKDKSDAVAVVRKGAAEIGADFVAFTLADAIAAIAPQQDAAQAAKPGAAS